MFDTNYLTKIKEIKLFFRFLKENDIFLLYLYHLENKNKECNINETPLSWLNKKHPSTFLFTAFGWSDAELEDRRNCLKKKYSWLTYDTMWTRFLRNHYK